MLKIRMNQAIDVQQNLERQLRCLDGQTEDLEHVMRHLDGLSGMDGVLQGLRRQNDRIEEARRTLCRMAQCLEKTILYYSSCEDRICDYAQQEAIAYRRYIIGASSLSSISGMCSP